MDTILQDTYKFFNMLLVNFNIQMFENGRTQNSISYLGEAYSVRGEYFLVSVVVKKNTTEVKVYKMTGASKVCVHQKNYSTVNDKEALSKSVSLFKFLSKVMF